MKIRYDTEPGAYTYTQNAHGKTASGVIRLGAQSQRDPAAQRAAGGVEREPGDHGGHLIAHSLGGRNDASNLDAQSAEVNQRGQRAIENKVAELAGDPNNKVYMEVSNYSSFHSDGSPGQRPDASMITIAVRNELTGQEDVAHFSLQNASYEEQAQWEQIANENVQIDPRQDIGMTPEERAIANELSEKYSFSELEDFGQGLSTQGEFYDGSGLTDGGMSASPAEYDGSSLETGSPAMDDSHEGGYDGGYDMD